MGADNWSVCPKCKLIGLKRQKTAIDKARDSYGKVSPVKYEVLLYKSRMPIEEEETLAEYYDLGITDVTEHPEQFYVSYKASCDKCGFKYCFIHEERINLHG